MKKYFLIILLLFPLLTFATNYYPKSTGDLSLTSNWGNATDGSGTAPINFTTAADVFIINKAGTVSSTWVVKNLTITSNTLTLSAPTTVNGILTLTSGVITSNGNLTINLNTGNIAGTGTGSIIGNITLTKNILSKGWHYISTPLSGVTLAQFNDNTVVKSTTCYYYDETLLSTNNQVGWIPYYTLTDPIEIGKGYILYYYGAGIIDMTGAYIHGSSYDINVTYNYSNVLDAIFNDANGWNLISNPYPSTVNWDNVTKTRIDDAIYYWDGANKRYASYISSNGASTNGGTKYISAFQAFFVKANSPFSPQPKRVSFASNDRVTNSSSLWREENVPNDIISIKVKGKTTVDDETVVRIVSEASDKFDGNWDAYKLYNGSGVPSIYTVSDIELTE